MNQLNKRLTWALSLFLIFFALSAATYWDVLSDPDQVLAFNDGNIECNLSPTYHFPDIMFSMWDNQTFFGSGAGQFAISIGAIGESIGAEFYRRVGQAIILALCALAFYWSCRQYRLNKVPSALTGAIISMTGWCNTFALSGLPVRPVALAFAALSLGFIERGRKTKSWLAYAIAGGCLGLSITEVPDVGAFLAISAAIIFWWTHCIPLPKGLNPASSHLLQPLPKFLLYVACSIILGWQTIAGVVGSQIQGVKQGSVESPEARYAWATQWSIPPEETWNLVSGGYFGNSMRSEAHPYWGRVGRSEGWEETRQGFRNFTMTGWHLGVVPFILLIALFIYMFRSKRDKQQVKSPVVTAPALSLPKGVPPVPASKDAADTPSTGSGQAAATTVIHQIAKETVLAYPEAQPRAFTLMIFLGTTISLMLMWGKYFFLYRLVWSLPYFSTIRNPDKWNGPFLLFAMLGVAFMLDILWRNLTQASASTSFKSSPNNSATHQLTNRETLRASLLWSALAMTGIALLILLGTSGNKEAFINHLIQDGYKDTAGIAYDNAIAACVKVLVIGGLCAWLVAVFVKRQTLDVKCKKGKDATSTQPPASSQSAFNILRLTPNVLLLSVLALLSLGDLYLDNRPYVTGHKYKHYLQPNPLTDYLDAHRTEGRIKILPPQHPLLNNLRLTLLTIKGYDLFDPISISRMPTDYEALFKALEKNPIRLWEIGSVRYFLTLPGGVDQLNKLDGNRGRFIERLALGITVVDGAYIPISDAPINQQYLRLVEFTGALPKYRLVGSRQPTQEDDETLKKLAEQEFDPATTVILAATPEAAVTSIQSSGVNLSVLTENPRKTILRVSSTQPNILVRACKYDPSWKTTINGKTATIIRANYLFQAIPLTAGTSVVSFDYSPPLNSLFTSWTSRVLLLIGILLYFRKDFRVNSSDNKMF